MSSGIYFIVNTVNDKVYVGSAVHVLRRWSYHESSLEGGYHHSVKLQRAWDKYGSHSFQFLLVEECEVADLTVREQSYMDVFSVVKNGYNVQPTARSSLGNKIPAEVKMRMSISAKLVAEREGESQRRSERAKAQHAAGKFGRRTWKGPARWNPRSDQSEALRRHVAAQTTEEMRRRGLLSAEARAAKKGAR